MTSPGYILFSGIVILQDPCTLDSQKGNRNVAFNINLPVKDGRKNALGFVRYFIPEERDNEMQKIWKEKYTEAFITARVTISFTENPHL